MDGALRGAFGDIRTRSERSNLNIWWWETSHPLLYLLARSFYPNLVKDRTAPASGDAEPDAPTLHAVRQRSLAYHLRLNRLRDDAIIPGHRGKTVRLSLERERESLLDEKRNFRSGSSPAWVEVPDKSTLKFLFLCTALQVICSPNFKW